MKLHCSSPRAPLPPPIAEFVPTRMVTVNAGSHSSPRCPLPLTSAPGGRSDRPSQACGRGPGPWPPPCFKKAAWDIARCPSFYTGGWARPRCVAGMGGPCPEAGTRGAPSACRRRLAATMSPWDIGRRKGRRAAAGKGGLAGCVVRGGGVISASSLLFIICKMSSEAKR